ncbi:unnamed protein product [Periconia digitata]|uniref:Uncharacterized protein n=1 Tax=Periconia digitata TaxID=1303443 RepID=A0A9W4USZ5_9PLEO|nr:unnamed protein product [Periconia digitata]
MSLSVPQAQDQLIGAPHSIKVGASTESKTLTLLVVATVPFILATSIAEAASLSFAPLATLSFLPTSFDADERDNLNPAHYF